MSLDSIIGHPALLETKSQRFLIMDAPTDSNLPKYVEMLKKRNVKHVVRTCGPTYSPDLILKAGIRFSDLQFKDGEPPPDDVVDKWLKLITEEFTESKDGYEGCRYDTI